MTNNEFVKDDRALKVIGNCKANIAEYMTVSTFNGNAKIFTTAKTIKTLKINQLFHKNKSVYR